MIPPGRIAARGGSATGLRAHGSEILFGALTLLAFEAFLGALTLLRWYPSLSAWALPATAGICALGHGLRQDRLAAPLRALLRGIALSCGLYACLMYPGVPVIAHDPAGLGALILPAGWAIASAAAVTSWWRPSWLLLCAVYLYWVKVTAQYLSGFTYHTQLDILPLYQVAGYLGASAIALRLLPRWPAPARRAIAPAEAARIIVFIAIAMQATNYFVASLAKTGLDGGPLDWVLHNRIVNSLGVALYNRQLLWGDSSGLVATVPRLVEHLERYASVAIVACQACALLAFGHKRLMLALFAFYDLMHVGVFLLGGGNFWMWFMLNLAIIAAVARLDAAFFDRRTLLAGAGLILLLVLIKPVVWLGWYDTRAVNSSWFAVVDAQGTRTRVPATFFGFYSYPIAHMSFGLPPGDYLPTGTNGSTPASRIYRESFDCRFSSHDSPMEAVWQPQALQAFIRGYHAYALRRADAQGHYGKALYPHHFWSAPSVEEAFARVDLRRVRSYVLITQSACVDIAGHADEVLYTHEYAIPLPAR